MNTIGVFFAQLRLEANATRLDSTIRLLAGVSDQSQVGCLKRGKRIKN